jgi:hypothetical protein
MSVMQKVDTNQSKEIKMAELNERERRVVQLFRLLDENAQKDILRFINVLVRR